MSEPRFENFDKLNFYFHQQSGHEAKIKDKAEYLEQRLLQTVGTYHATASATAGLVAKCVSRPV
jgi:hypothetical protein